VEIEKKGGKYFVKIIDKKNYTEVKVHALNIIVSKFNNGFAVGE
jgi:hypothetical protein